MKIDVTKYWLEPPPEPSPRLNIWLDKIKTGWRKNCRIGGMGYHEASEWFGVYIWEYLNVILPLFLELEEQEATPAAPCPPDTGDGSSPK